MAHAKGDARPINTQNISHSRISAAEVNKLDFANWTIKEPGTEALELFNGVCGEAAQGGFRGDLIHRSAISLRTSGTGWVLLGEDEGGGIGSCFGGVDDSNAVGNSAGNEWAQQRVMRAAENQRIGIEPFRGGLGVEFLKVDADDFGGYGMVCPAFLN